MKYAGVFPRITAFITRLISAEAIPEAIFIAVILIDIHAVDCRARNRLIHAPVYINCIKPDRQNRIIVSAAANGANFGNLGIIPINGHQTGQVVFHR